MNISYEMQQQRENVERTQRIEQAKDRPGGGKDTTAQKDEDKEKTDGIEKGKRGPGAL